jgi:hypothetical protein
MHTLGLLGPGSSSHALLYFSTIPRRTPLDVYRHSVTLSSDSPPLFVVKHIHYYYSTYDIGIYSLFVCTSLYLSENVIDDVSLIFLSRVNLRSALYPGRKAR